MEILELQKKAEKRLKEVNDRESYTIALTQIAFSVVPKDTKTLLELVQDNWGLVTEPPEINLKRFDRAIDLIAWKVFEQIEEYLWDAMHHDRYIDVFF